MEWRSDKMRLDKIRNPSLPSTNMKINDSRAVGQISRSAWHGLHPKQAIRLAPRKMFLFLILKDSRNTGLVATYNPSCKEGPIETPWQDWRRRRTWGFFSRVEVGIMSGLTMYLVNLLFTAWGSRGPSRSQWLKRGSDSCTPWLVIRDSPKMIPFRLYKLEVPPYLPFLQPSFSITNIQL